MASQSQASSSNSSRSSSPTTCHRAHIRTLSAKEHSAFRPAWLSILCCVRWKYIASKDEVPPDSLTAFYGTHCLSLEKVAPHAAWKDVEEAVSSVDTSEGPGLIVQGKLLRRRISLSSSKAVELTIVAGDEHERDLWVELLRMRVAPWELLARRVTDLLNSGLTIVKFRKMLGCVEESTINRGINSGSNDRASTSDIRASAMDGVNTLSNFIQTVAVIVQTSAPAVKETAVLVGNIAKSVTIDGSAFQVAMLCVTLLDMAREAKRSYSELPRILAKVVELQSSLVKSMVPVLHPEGQVDVVSLKRMSEVQENVSSTLYELEMRMLRGVVRRFLKVGDLRKFEAAAEKLSESVEPVILSGKIAGIAVDVADQRDTLAQHGAEIQQLKQDAIPRQILAMCERPRVTRYFSGRKEELSELKKKLEEYGSAAIMQFGGSGKTQLMTAFADRAEKNGWIPGGCFWRQANGNMAQFLPFLVNFAEVLTGMKISEIDRGDKCKVLTVIRGSY